MKIEEFDYINARSEKSHRRVMIVNNHKDFIDALDLDKLDETEIKTVLEAQQEYEAKIQPMMKKSFRRFNKNNITELQIEEIKPGEK